MSNVNLTCNTDNRKGFRMKMTHYFSMLPHTNQAFLCETHTHTHATAHPRLLLLLFPFPPVSHLLFHTSTRSLAGEEVEVGNESIWLASLSPQWYNWPTYRMCHLKGMSIPLATLHPPPSPSLSPTGDGGIHHPVGHTVNVPKCTTQPQSSRLIF